MTKNEKPTQDRVKELFHYDPETGLFTRRSSQAERGKKDRKYGRVGAGSISTLGYVLVAVDQVKFLAASLAWLYVHGVWPDGRVKYINGNPLDNRLENIRVQNLDPKVVKDKTLTQERLKEVLHYEPENGLFTWRINTSVAKPGERAGCDHGMGYRNIGIDYKKYLEHTLAYLYMTGEMPPFEIDHINGDKADNRWVNLRSATRSQNGHNKPNGRRGSGGGFPGVRLHGGKYVSRIELGSSKYLGLFYTVAEARVRRLLEEKVLFERFTSWLETRDSKLPFGDKIAEMSVEDDKLFVSKDGQKHEVIEVADLVEVMKA